MLRLSILFALIALGGCGMRQNGPLCEQCGPDKSSTIEFYTFHIDETKQDGFITPPDDCPYSMAVSDFENDDFPYFICRDI